MTWRRLKTSCGWWAYQIGRTGIVLRDPDRELLYLHARALQWRATGMSNSIRIRIRTYIERIQDMKKRPTDPKAFDPKTYSSNLVPCKGCGLPVKRNQVYCNCASTDRSGSR
jgi:hypothetical protein